MLSHVIEYGEEVSSLPTLTPFSVNLRLHADGLSDDFAESVTAEPPTVAPFDGAIIDPTFDGFVSTLIVMTLEVA